MLYWVSEASSFTQFQPEREGVFALEQTSVLLDKILMCLYKSALEIYFIDFCMGFTALTRIFHLDRAYHSSKVGENWNTWKTIAQVPAPYVVLLGNGWVDFSASAIV